MLDLLPCPSYVTWVLWVLNIVSAKPQPTSISFVVTQIDKCRLTLPSRSNTINPLMGNIKFNHVKPHVVNCKGVVTFPLHCMHQN
jgi:hypothetical protein